jgi:hypothetical protein
MIEGKEQLFAKGFNQGYLLARYEPDILTSVLKNNNPINSYFSGLSFGKKEFEIEQATSEISKLRNSKKIEKDSREY